MVKNTQGGNRAKKQARKNTVPLDESMVKARFSTDPDEIYACCAQLLGNGMCHVMCVDGQKRICVIRNKFRGKGKRGNILSVGTWCLVGRRDFEKPKEGKLEKTDLLEVYGDIEKKKIYSKEIALKDQWKLFNAYDSSIHNVANYDEDVSFTRTTDFEEPGLNSMYSDDEDGGMGSPLIKPGVWGLSIMKTGAWGLPIMKRGVWGLPIMKMKLISMTFNRLEIIDYGCGLL